VKRYTVVLFDFDGTLYDSEGHFDQYVREITTHLSENRGRALVNAYAATRQQTGMLRIGEWYNPTRQQSVAHTAKTEETPQGYYMGDYWWIIHALGLFQGATEEQLASSFLRTREYMMHHTEEIQMVFGLKDWLTEAKRREFTKIVLATNSPAQDSIAILGNLGVLDLFADVVCNAQKPAGMPAVLERITREFHVAPDQILSIGDHYYNDIAPAISFGADTLFINRHMVSHPREATYEVQTSEQLISLLKNEIWAALK